MSYFAICYGGHKTVYAHLSYARTVTCKCGHETKIVNAEA
jgi:hypothetical protein